MPELRKDPITGRWVIISTDRAKRPIGFRSRKRGDQGNRDLPVLLRERIQDAARGSAIRAQRQRAEHVRAGKCAWFPTNFPALGIEGDLDREGEGLFDRMNGVGAHEVIIETPDHRSTLATMSEKQIEDVLWAFRDRMLDLKNDRRFRYILIFKNHGEAAGASLEHPHSQLIALPIVPKRVREEVDSSRHYYYDKERCIFCDMIRQELESGVRVIGETNLFVTLAPYAPRFPFEMWILPKQHASAFENNQSLIYAGLAKVLKDNLARLDVVLDRPAYNLMIHTSPIGEETNEHYHWHIEIIPKLTKVAGFEWGTGFYICPTPPEESARFIREAQVMPVASR